MMKVAGSSKTPLPKYQTTASQDSDLQLNFTFFNMISLFKIMLGHTYKVNLHMLIEWKETSTYSTSLDQTDMSRQSHTPATLDQGMNSQYPLIRMTCGPGSWSGLSEEEGDGGSKFLQNVPTHLPHYNTAIPNQNIHHRENLKSYTLIIFYQ